MSDNSQTQYQPPNDVGSQGLAKVYAQALLSSALQRNEVDNVLEELDSLINDIFTAQPLLEDMFCAPSYRSRPRKRIWSVSSAIARASCSATFYRYSTATAGWTCSA